MSRKHFRLLAEAISEIKDEEIRKDTASKIGSVCSKLNPLFNWYTWKAACGVKD
jgi:hypothetical protein